MTVTSILTSYDIREFKKLRRRRQRERHKTIGFNEQNNALHVRFKFWYISLPSSAKQQREMTKFKVLWRARAHDGKFSFLCTNLNAVPTCSVTG